LGEKVQSQKGNSPARILRSLNTDCVYKKVFWLKQPADWLGSRHSLLKA